MALCTLPTSIRAQHPSMEQPYTPITIERPVSPITISIRQTRVRSPVHDRSEKPGAQESDGHLIYKPAKSQSITKQGALSV